MTGKRIITEPLQVKFTLPLLRTGHNIKCEPGPHFQIFLFACAFLGALFFIRNHLKTSSPHRFLPLCVFFEVELNPYAAHVYFNRGNLYASLRKYKESEEDYTRGKR